MARLALSVPGDPPDVAKLEALWMGLGDLPLEGLEPAVDRAVRACKFFPSVAELRRYWPRDPEAPVFLEGAGYVPLLPPSTPTKTTEEQHAQMRADIAALRQHQDAVRQAEAVPPPSWGARPSGYTSTAEVPERACCCPPAVVVQGPRGTRAAYVRCCYCQNENTASPCPVCGHVPGSPVPHESFWRLDAASQRARGRTRT